MIDKNGKFFGKLNVIDALVLVLVVVVAAGFAYGRFAPRVQQFLTAETPIYFTFMTESVRPFSVDAVAPGDALFRQHESHAPLGHVVRVETVPNYTIVQNRDGTAVSARNQGRYNLFITLEGRGHVRPEGFFLNGTTQVAPGSVLPIQSQRMFGTSTVFWVGEALPAPFADEA